jgi:hypothetical protein
VIICTLRNFSFSEHIYVKAHRNNNLLNYYHLKSYSQLQLYISSMTGTKTAVSQISLDTEDYSSIRLPTQGTAYSPKCFRQRKKIFLSPLSFAAFNGVTAWVLWKQAQTSATGLCILRNCGGVTVLESTDPWRDCVWCLISYALMHHF